MFRSLYIRNISVKIRESACNYNLGCSDLRITRVTSREVGARAERGYCFTTEILFQQKTNIL